MTATQRQDGPRIARPEDLSPGSEAYWQRKSDREWVAMYDRRSLVIERSSNRSPMLSAFIDGRKVFGRVRFLPLAQQRCEAIVRLERSAGGA